MSLEIENPFKFALQSGHRQFGIWSALTHHLLAEVMGDAGFDWILFDTEHAPNDLMLLISQMQALRGSGAESVVRPAYNDPVWIKRVLDIGFRSVLIPFVQSAEEAARAVASTRYPPAGIRGVAAYQRNNKYGRVTDYFDFIDNAIAVVAQIETAIAMKELKAIALTPGVDAIFIGPGDLAASLGHLGRPMAPQVQEAIRQIGKETKELGTPAGIVAGSPADVERYLEWGFSFYTISSDAAVFRSGLETIVRTLPGLRSYHGIVT
jgi:2-keto-3-deoxy-L-rhamnonate aldolase RhmA